MNEAWMDDGSILKSETGISFNVAEGKINIPPKQHPNITVDIYINTYYGGGIGSALQDIHEVARDFGINDENLNVDVDITRWY